MSAKYANTIGRLQEMGKGSGGGAGPRGNSSRGLSKPSGHLDPGLLERPNVNISASDLQAAEDFFGQGSLSKEFIGALTNGVDGGDVSVIHQDGELLLSTWHNGVRARRTISRIKGELVAKNEIFTIADDSPYKGHGTEMLASQVIALKAAGVVKIKTTAAGHAKSQGKWNGYYTWARAGYDGKIPAKTWRKLPSGLKRQMGTSRSVQDLMSKAGGKEAWKQHGAQFQGTFNTRDGSRSMKVLQAYVAERASRGK